MTTATGFRPLSLEDLFALELPDLEYVVDGILPLGRAGLLSAREKAGKGLMSIDCGASIALGESFLDRATMEGPTIYAAAEEDVRDVRDRIKNRIGDRRDAPFYVLPLDGSTEDRLDLADADSMQRLYNMVVDVRPVLVTLDVLRELHDRTEDSSDEMGPLLRPIRQLAHETNTSILVTHHMAKAGHFRGSTAIKAAFDFEWALTGSGDDEGAPSGILRVEGRHGPRVVLRVAFGDGGRWELSTAPLADLITPDRIVLYLEEANDWRTAKEIADAIGKPLKTVQNELSRLRATDPCPIATAGTGRRGDPRRYRSRSIRMGGMDCSQTGDPLRDQSRGNNNSASASQNPDLFPNGFGNNRTVPNGPGNNPGNNGNNRACVECGEATVPGALYCERHGGWEATVDPAILRTARNLADLSAEEFEQYRADLEAAADDDPNLAHDREAFALAARIRAGQAPAA